MICALKSPRMIKESCRRLDSFWALFLFLFILYVSHTIRVLMLVNDPLTLKFSMLQSGLDECSTRPPAGEQIIRTPRQPNRRLPLCIPKEQTKLLNSLEPCIYSTEILSGKPSADEQTRPRFSMQYRIQNHPPT